MSNPYSGSAAGLDEDSAVTITEPADGDDLNAASANAALSKLADELEFLRANTVKRTLGALGASSPSGQTGPVPYRIASTEAFDFYAALQTHSDPHPIAKYIPIGGDDGQRDTRTYYDINGNLIVSRGCASNGGVSPTWKRSGTRTGVAYKYTFGIDGLTIQVKNAGGAGDTWLDSAWDVTRTFDAWTGVQGDVVGLNGSGGFFLGRPREPLSTAFAALTGWVAGTSAAAPRGFVDASGVVHLQGELDTSGGTTAASGNIAQMGSPLYSTGRDISVIGRIGSSALTPNDQPVVLTIDHTSGILSYASPTGGGLASGSFITLDGISYALP